MAPRRAAVPREANPSLDSIGKMGPLASWRMRGTGIGGAEASIQLTRRTAGPQIASIGGETRATATRAPALCFLMSSFAPTRSTTSARMFPNHVDDGVERLPRLALPAPTDVEKRGDARSRPSYLSRREVTCKYHQFRFVGELLPSDVPRARAVSVAVSGVCAGEQLAESRERSSSLAFSLIATPVCRC